LPFPKQLLAAPGAVGTFRPPRSRSDEEEGIMTDLANTYARHFLTAKQFAQEAGDARGGDPVKLARAIRELSDGLLWLAGDIIYVREQTLAKAPPAPAGTGKSSFKRPTM
jgi:hypothetical protein